MESGQENARSEGEGEREDDHKHLSTFLPFYSQYSLRLEHNSHLAPGPTLFINIPFCLKVQIIIILCGGYFS